MHFRRFGRTELHLSVFSLGMMRCLAAQPVFEATLRRALDLGLNHIETARGYGTSERWLGQWLKDNGRPEGLVITTKIPPQPDQETMARHIDDSLDRLQVDRIDCLAIHGLNTWDHLAWVQQPQGCMAAVRQAQEQGRIGHVGFSTHGFREVVEAAIATDLFAFVNLHYYFFFQRQAAALNLARQLDLGLFIISPGDKGGMLYTPPDQLRQLCQPFEPLALTYRWLLSNPAITTLSTGPAHPEELEFLVDLGHQTQPLTPPEAAALARLEAHQTATLGPDQCRQCYQCLPCPEEIHIPEVLRLRNLTLAFDMQAYGQYRYGMFENAGHWFPGRKAHRCTDCGDCLPRCPEHLPIPSLLRDTHDRLKGPHRRRLWDA
ncbi:MAG TPA: aldo/keto reductase [Leptolyngbyaceae cyanobacterium M65_K2018_010]|nr:aldo/keto reductase [Leptolyngbyaceae cyanobacterium M65_K2018_010]